MSDEVCPTCGRRKPGRRKDNFEERLWGNIDKNGPYPDNGVKGRCWVWTGLLNPSGYAYIWLDGKYQRVHRVVWKLMKKEPLVKGKVLDHRCNRKHCCRPGHLRQVTGGDNTRRYHKEAR